MYTQHWEAVEAGANNALMLLGKARAQLFALQSLMDSRLSVLPLLLLLFPASVVLSFFIPFVGSPLVHLFSLPARMRP
eukprot:gene20807-27642_t